MLPLGGKWEWKNRDYIEYRKRNIPLIFADILKLIKIQKNWRYQIRSVHIGAKKEAP
jgi:hypothetical protein